MDQFSTHVCSCLGLACLYWQLESRWLYRSSIEMSPCSSRGHDHKHYMTVFYCHIDMWAWNSWLLAMLHKYTYQTSHQPPMSDHTSYECQPCPPIRLHNYARGCPNIYMFLYFCFYSRTNPVLPLGQCYTCSLHLRCNLLTVLVDELRDIVSSLLHHPNVKGFSKVCGYVVPPFEWTCLFHIKYKGKKRKEMEWKEKREGGDMLSW